MLSLRVVWYYIKPVLFALWLLPFGWLALRTFEIVGPDLGANPIEEIQDTLGIWGLRFLVLTIAITPLKDWTGQPSLIALRRMIGLFGFFFKTVIVPSLFALWSYWSVQGETIAFAEVRGD